MCPDRDKPDIHANFDSSKANTGERLHPHAEKILEEIRTVLNKSRTGTHLLNISDSYGVSLNVSPSPEDAGFIANTNRVVIDAPDTQNKATARQILNLAGHLRDLEQGILGFGRKREDLSKEDQSDLNHAKNLDIIMDMCKISEELEDEVPEIKTELYNMGLKPFFQAYKKKAGQDELIEAYKTVILDGKKDEDGTE